MEKNNTNLPAPPGAPSASDRLDSWKEIAAYLKRDPRTVQRWEKKEGLPVHRHVHEQQATVYAFRSEIDAWWGQRRAFLENEPEPLETEEASPPPPPSPRPGPSRRDKIILAVVLIAVVLGLGRYFRCRLGFCPAGKTMLAVLPFENLSGDPTQAYMSDGLTEDIITQLGRLDPERLGVIARTTVIDPDLQGLSVEAIGRRLKVHYVLEGSYRRTGDNIRIVAQLIQVSDQTHLWTDTYDVTRPVADALDIQKEVAVRVANSLALQLLPVHQDRLKKSIPVNPRAYEAFLRGRHVWHQRTEEGFRQGMAYMQQAIAADPQLPLAQSGLADLYVSLGFYSLLPPREAYPRGKEAARRALALDDSLAEAHASMGAVLGDYEWDWAGADREYQRAIALNPSYSVARQWYSQFLALQGRFDEALQHMEIARQLDPLGPVVNADVALHYYYRRQFDKAVAQSREMIRINPDFPLAHIWLGVSLLALEKPREAITEFQHARSAGLFSVALLGMAYGRAGQRQDALRVIGEFEKLSKKRFVSAAYFSLVYIGLGDKDKAMVWMERAFVERSPLLVRLKVDPIVDPLRGDPRFEDLVRRVGLP